MKKVGFFIVLLVMSMNALAQQKIGFTNPDNIDPLLNYRLPDWGYSNFYITFTSVGSSSNFLNKIPDIDRNSTKHFDLSAAPAYNLYRESEKRILMLTSSVNAAYTNDQSSASPENDETNTKDFENRIDLEVSLKEYFSPLFFGLIDETTRFSYDHSLNREREGNSLSMDQETTGRNFASITQLGIGIGRIRNVSPMIRALRMDERYGILANKSLNKEQIKKAADIFTRYDGYQSRYDRPEKYFWRDMNDAVSGAISNLEPFDLFYLTDVLDENIGRRLQGWEVSSGGIFNYSNNLTRQENAANQGGSSLSRTLGISKAVGIFLGAQWYKNLSLKHQLGLAANATRYYPLDSNAFVKWNTALYLQFNWLWNLTDRFLLKTTLSNNYNVSKYNAGFSNGQNHVWSDNGSASSNFIYFIENRLALSASVQYSLRYSGDGQSNVDFLQRNRLWNFRAGIRYYFSRNLY